MRAPSGSPIGGRFEQASSARHGWRVRDPHRRSHRASSVDGRSRAQPPDASDRRPGVAHPRALGAGEARSSRGQAAPAAPRDASRRRAPDRARARARAGPGGRGAARLRRRGRRTPRRRRLPRPRPRSRWPSPPRPRWRSTSRAGGIAAAPVEAPAPIAQPEAREAVPADETPRRVTAPAGARRRTAASKRPCERAETERAIPLPVAHEPAAAAAPAPEAPAVRPVAPRAATSAGASAAFHSALAPVRRHADARRERVSEPRRRRRARPSVRVRVPSCRVLRVRVRSTPGSPRPVASAAPGAPGAGPAATRRPGQSGGAPPAAVSAAAAPAATRRPGVVRALGAGTATAMAAAAVARRVQAPRRSIRKRWRRTSQDHDGDARPPARGRRRRSTRRRPRGAGGAARAPRREREKTTVRVNEFITVSELAADPQGPADADRRASRSRTSG